MGSLMGLWGHLRGRGVTYGVKRSLMGFVGSLMGTLMGRWHHLRGLRCPDGIWGPAMGRWDRSMGSPPLFDFWGAP